MTSRLIALSVLAFLTIEYVICNNPPAGGNPPEKSGNPAPAAPSPNGATQIPSSEYPTPKRDEKVQDTFGNNVVVKDPYREFEKIDSPETKKFIEDEMAITKPYLEKAPNRAELIARFKELYDYPYFFGFMQFGKKFFTFQKTGTQDQNVVYVHNSYKEEGKVVLDPNTDEFQKNNETLDSTGISDDGSIIAYLCHIGGSQWQTIRFKSVEKGDTYKETLTRVKNSGLSWTFDNKGVFYAGYLDFKGKTDGSDTTPVKNQKLYYHLVGTDQSKDVMVAEFPDNPDSVIDANVSDDGKYLIVSVAQDTGGSMIYVADLDKIKYEIKTKLELIPVKKETKYNMRYVTNIDKIFYFVTNYGDTDNYKLITIDITNTDPKSWKDLVPADKSVLQWATAAYEKYLILSYTVDVKTVLQVHDIQTGKMIKKLPLDIGTVTDTGFRSDKRYKDIFMNFQSFLTPGIIYHCDLSNPAFELDIVKEIKVKNFDRNKYTVEQVFYPSKDGTKVPLFMTYKKDLQKNGNNFTFLKANGGFTITTLPYFVPNRVIIMENYDGIHAFACIRGGGEYGESWHRDGTLDKKQNTFDDLQAAAEYLIKEKYTSNKLLAISGSSNGGLTMAASLNQRPDLFQVVLIDEGMLDMMRFDKFTIGKLMLTEFGTPSKPQDFEIIHKYSPLHNIKIPTEGDKQYPAVFVTCPVPDDKIPPSNSLKFIAELQYQAKQCPNQKNPFLFEVQGNTGKQEETIANLVDWLSFIVLNTGIKYHA